MADFPDFTKVTKAKYRISLSGTIFGRTSDMEADLDENGNVFDTGTTQSIRGFIQMDNPDKYKLSIIVVNMMVDQQTRVKIEKYKNEMVYRLKISVLDYITDNESNTYKEYGETVVADGFFQAYIPSADSGALDFDDNTTLEMDENGNVTNNIGIMTNYSILKLSLQVMGARELYRSILNFNAGSPKGTVKVFPVLTAGITKAIYDTQNSGKLRGSVLLQPPDNNTEYDQIICPPYILPDFIEHLQANYGLYKHGLIIFRDMSYFYVIPKFSTNYVTANGEYNTVRIALYDSDFAVNGESVVGYYQDDDSQSYAVVQASKYNIKDLTELTRESTGGVINATNDTMDMMSVKYDGGNFTRIPNLRRFDLKNRPPDEFKYLPPRERYVRDHNNNAYGLASNIFDITSSRVVVSVGFRDVDLNIMTFNRAYLLEFKVDESINNKYGGYYRLAECTKMISQSDGNEPMVAQIACTFVKIE